VEDSLNATRAAVEEGIVPGGGSSTRRQTCSHRILGAYPTFPRSDDNKDAVIASISLCPNRGKSIDFVLISGQ